jgi:heme exporter protein C
MDGTPQTTPARGSALHRFANPGRFMRLSGAVLPWLALSGLLFSTVGLAWGLVFAPRDWQQGDTVRIMFVHVPAAWMAMGGYLGLAVASFVGLVWRHPLADIAAREIAPVGAVFTAICLITGSLWGKPMWGTWWVWDARLTSVLVLFFLYLGHIALSNAFDEPDRAARPAAILALIGAVNLPIIKFSVDWWNTLHQPASVTRIGAPGIHIDILQPLLVTGAGFLFVFAALALLRIRAGILERRARALMAARAAEPAASAATVPV